MSFLSSVFGHWMSLQRADYLCTQNHLGLYSEGLSQENKSVMPLIPELRRQRLTLSSRLNRATVRACLKPQNQAVDKLSKTTFFVILFIQSSEPVTETPTVDGRRDALSLMVVPTECIRQNASWYISTQLGLV